VPRYLTSGNYEPIKSKETISNAMDVGNPSNFIRMKLLAGENWESVSKLIKGYQFTDEETREEMKAFQVENGYIMCPHTAVGQLGANKYKNEINKNVATIVLSTAHYAKFLPVMEEALGFTPPIPDRLSALLSKKKVATKMSASFDDFKAWLL
jgi:threonine synthase